MTTVAELCQGLLPIASQRKRVSWPVVFNKKNRRENEKGHIQRMEPRG